MTRCLPGLALVGMLLLALRLIGVVTAPWWVCATPLIAALLGAAVLFTLLAYDRSHHLEDA